MADTQSTDSPSVPSSQPIEEESAEPRPFADLSELSPTKSTEPTSNESTKPSATESNPPASPDPSQSDTSIKKESISTSPSLPKKLERQDPDLAEDDIDITDGTRDRLPRERSRSPGGPGGAHGRGRQSSRHRRDSSPLDQDDRWHRDSGRLKMSYRLNIYRPNYDASPERRDYDYWRDRSPIPREPLSPQRGVPGGRGSLRGYSRRREPGNHHPREDISWDRRESREFRESRDPYKEDRENRESEYSRDYTRSSQPFSPPRGPSAEYPPNYTHPSQRFSPPRAPSAYYRRENSGSYQEFAPPRGPTAYYRGDYIHPFQSFYAPRGPSADYRRDNTRTSQPYSPPRGPSAEYRRDGFHSSQRYPPPQRPSRDDEYYYERSDQDTQADNTRTRQEQPVCRDAQVYERPSPHSPRRTRDDSNWNRSKHVIDGTERMDYEWTKPNPQRQDRHLEDMAREYRFTREQPELIPYYEPRPWTRATAEYPPEMDYQATNDPRSKKYRRSENDPPSRPRTSSDYPPRDMYRPTSSGGGARDPVPPRTSPYSPRETYRPTSQGRDSRPPTRSAYSPRKQYSPSSPPYRPTSQGGGIQSPRRYSRPPTRDHPSPQ